MPKQIRKFLLFCGLIIITFISVICFQTSHLKAQSLDPRFPDLQTHPLPSSLTQWQDQDLNNDYFNLIEPSPFGYLIWSQFPLKVYVDHPLNPDLNVSSDRRFLQWVDIVTRGIQDWGKYLSLEIIDQPEIADIIIERKQPPRATQIDPETGNTIRSRAKTAQTTYEFYLTADQPPILRHRMKIMISPGKNPEALLSASRHEFGHALGLWGHSELETDIMYYAQVRDYPEISSRDLNTLKKIYQQPTRLGWALKLDVKLILISIAHRASVI